MTRSSRSPEATALADHTGGELVALEGSGHGPHVRDPVKVNLLLRDFVRPAPPTSRWVRGKSRRKRALYVSSPIGLGHAQRDAAIADELRKLHPDLEIDWLAGWIRSPRASSTAVTGCCASQSISRSGWSLRSSSAIAASRWAWPRPIGEET